MMTIAAYLIAAYPTREFDSGSWIGSWWSVKWSAPPFSFSHDVDWEQLIGSDVIELKVRRSMSLLTSPPQLASPAPDRVNKRFGRRVKGALIAINGLTSQSFRLCSASQDPRTRLVDPPDSRRLPARPSTLSAMRISLLTDPHDSAAMPFPAAHPKMSHGGRCPQTMFTK
jgi:hypothetical protein